MSNVTADPYSLNAAGLAYEDAAYRVKDVVDTLWRSLSPVLPFWGADETGQQFQIGTVPGLFAFLDSVGQLFPSMQSMSDAVRQWARDQLHIDEATATAASQILAPVEVSQETPTVNVGHHH